MSVSVHKRGRGSWRTKTRREGKEKEMREKGTSKVNGGVSMMTKKRWKRLKWS